jgi:hypothetical protein
VTKTYFVRRAARAKSVGLSATIAGSGVCAYQRGLFERRPRWSHRRARAWYGMRRRCGRVCCVCRAW